MTIHLVDKKPQVATENPPQEFPPTVQNLSANPFNTLRGLVMGSAAINDESAPEAFNQIFRNLFAPARPAPNPTSQSAQDKAEKLRKVVKSIDESTERLSQISQSQFASPNSRLQPGECESLATALEEAGVDVKNKKRNSLNSNYIRSTFSHLQVLCPDKLISVRFQEDWSSWRVSLRTPSLSSFICIFYNDVI